MFDVTFPHVKIVFSCRTYFFLFMAHILCKIQTSVTAIYTGISALEILVFCFKIINSSTIKIS